MAPVVGGRLNSIVLELQRDALDPNAKVSDLLRKAMVVARKLRINELEGWLKFEVNGYPEDHTDFPAYRFMEGQVKALNPYRGWIPVVFEDPKLARSCSRRP